MTPPPNGWVLYDGECGFCVRWATVCTATLRRHGYDLAPLQSPWVCERLTCTPEELVSDIRLLRADGTHARGSDVYIEVMRHIWWAWPFSRIARLPGLNYLFDLTYRTVAKNRSLISQTCRLPAPDLPSPPDDSDLPPR